jgi:hypothetical protein
MDIKLLPDFVEIEFKFGRIAGVDRRPGFTGQMNIVDFYLSQTVSGTNENLNDVIEKVKKVTPEEIVRVASDISLDTVYFLTAPDQ